MRGATQREVKLEITGTKNDELIQYLDDVLSGLKYQDGHYDLVRLKDENYQAKLDVQMNYWQSLKREIAKVRENGYENTDIGKGERVSYAQGWAISSDYSHCTLQTLFNAADKYMYTNKQREKLGRQG